MKRIVKKSFVIFCVIFVLVEGFGSHPMEVYAKSNVTAFSTETRVQNLKKKNVKENSIQISWKKMKGAGGYQIYRAASTNRNYKKIATSKKTTYTNKKLKAGKKYYYKVRAYKGSGKTRKYSKFSKPIAVKTKKANTPQTPETPASDKTKTYVQRLDYSESTDKINNPDQGFYRTMSITVSDKSISDRKNVVSEDIQLYHLRFDLSNFSKANNGVADKPLSKTALKKIDKLLLYLRKNEKNAIVRCAYAPGFGGDANKEPSLSMMLKHIRQLSEVYEKYPDVITAIEVGMVGPWGEMHTSKKANAKTINALVDEFLENTTQIPILVRTPKMIYNYLGITLKKTGSYRIQKTDKAYRLGLFNDGYLGSNSDLGTYTNRKKEVNWLSMQTDHLPFGGEVVVPESRLHDIERCLPEMFLMNLSYLNEEWNDTVIRKWKKTTYSEAAGNDTLYHGKTAFNYIENHMGYRFVLKKSKFSYTDKLDKIKIQLKLNNVGFGNLNRTKKMKLLFVDATGKTTVVKAGNFKGQQTVTIEKPISLPAGTYQVYLKIDDGNGRYPIRFANHLWKKSLKANLIGSFKKF